MRRKRKLTPKGAVWSALFATPVLVVAAVTIIGVTAGSAGPSTPATTAAPAATQQSTGGPVSQTTALGSGQQTLAQLKAYWTPEVMASAAPYPMPTVAESSTPNGSIETVDAPSTLRWTRQTPSGGVETGSIGLDGAAALTEPFHSPIPFSRWEWFGRYLRNVPAGSPNTGISTQHKMFFTQGGGNFVCSSSSTGTDGVWTAGHCVHGGPGVGFSTNVLFCPSYDSAQGGINPTAGCWGAEELWTWAPEWSVNENLDWDFGGADASDTGTAQATLIGSYTGFNSFGYFPTNGFGPSNLPWMAFGYPQAAPFNGGKIHTCASSLGYADDSDPGFPGASVSMGCDMTGGSSGGPWLFDFGKPGQIAGGGSRILNGHNDWRHTAEPGELNSPYFNCRAVLMWWAINDLTPGACP